MRLVEWAADVPLVGFQIWGDLGRKGQLGLPLTHHGALKTVLPLIEENTKIFLYNSATVPNLVTITGRDEKAATTVSDFFMMIPGQRVELSRDQIAEDFEGALTIESTATLTAWQEVHRTQADGSVLSDAIPGRDQFGRSFLIPHVAVFDQWSTEVMAVNTGSAEQPLTITGYSADGQVVDQITLPVAAGGRLHHLVQELFPGSTGIAYLTLEGQQPTWVAHLLFQTNVGMGKVMAGTEIEPLE